MLHPLLIADCHHLSEWTHCQILLHRNGIIPWFILVPRTEASDLLELPREEREAVLDEAACVARFIQQHWQLSKLNFAQLGNVVPQMHLHIIGRRPDDSCWPKPVWGNLSEEVQYDDVRVQEIRDRLEQFRSNQTL